MYELLWDGRDAGAPFERLEDDNDNDDRLSTSSLVGTNKGTTTRLRSKSGTVVQLIGNVAEVLEELYSDPKWKDTMVGISSRTDEPAWARELLHKFTLSSYNEQCSSSTPPEASKARQSNRAVPIPLKTVFTGPWEIAYDSKTAHFERISETTGVALESMLFFDNEAGNCRSVSKLGVSVCYCPDGVTRSAFDQAVASFPCSRGNVVGLDT